MGSVSSGEMASSPPRWQGCPGNLCRLRACGPAEPRAAASPSTAAPLRPPGGRGRGPSRVSLRPTDSIRGDGRVRWELGSSAPLTLPSPPSQRGEREKERPGKQVLVANLCKDCPFRFPRTAPRGRGHEAVGRPDHDALRQRNAQVAKQHREHHPVAHGDDELHLLPRLGDMLRHLGPNRIRNGRFSVRRFTDCATGRAGLAQHPAREWPMIRPLAFAARSS